MVVLTLNKVLVQWQVLVFLSDHQIGTVLLVVNVVILSFHQLLVRVQLIVLIETGCTLKTRIPIFHHCHGQESQLLYSSQGLQVPVYNQLSSFCPDNFPQVIRK